MATFSICRVILFLILFSFLQALFVTPTEFQVGGKDGWTIPKSKNVEELYNQWASKNRFKVNDTIHFVYDKDSVLEVTDEEYEKCKSTRPLFYSNNGDTMFTLDRPGLFYFISGVSGHCERGQKMIIKVLEPESPPPAPSQNSTSDNSSSSTAAGSMAINRRHMILALSMFSIVSAALLI